jgi:DNA-directed RNA polymerase specialized sigma24 family protein
VDTGAAARQPAGRLSQKGGQNMTQENTLRNANESDLQRYYDDLVGKLKARGISHHDAEDQAQQAICKSLDVKNLQESKAWLFMVTKALPSQVQDTDVVSEGKESRSMTPVLMEQLKKTQWDPIVAFLEHRGAGGRGEFFASEAMSKVWRYVKKHPCTTLKHAKAILWRAGKQVLADYFKCEDRHGFEREALDKVDERMLASGTGLLNAFVDRERREADQKTREAALEELQELPDAKLLLQGFQGDAWKEIAKDLDVKVHVARTHLVRVFASFAVRLADEGIDKTLLERFRKKHGDHGEEALRLWLGKDQTQPKHTASKLNISVAEAQKLQKNIIAFFRKGLERKKKG